MNELALFAGAGGGILGGKLLGWRTVCAVEWDAYARDVLVARQNDGSIDPFPIWDDVQTFDGRPWRGRVDVVSGGFPCQDISVAGNGEGIEGERSGMWKHMARIVCEVRPRFVFVENSPVLTSRGLGTVLGDLAAMGYDARWGVLGADDAGAPHQRRRIWIVADAGCTLLENRPQGERDWGRGDVEQHASCAPLHDSNGSDRNKVRRQASRESRHARQPGRGTGEPGTNLDWPPEPGVGRLADGVAARVDQLRCLGNGQVPRVAAMAWRILAENDEPSHPDENER